MRGRAAAQKREFLALTGTDYADEHDECCRLAYASRQMTPVAECGGCQWVGEVRAHERAYVLSAMDEIAVNAVLQSAARQLRRAVEPDSEVLL